MMVLAQLNSIATSGKTAASTVASTLSSPRAVQARRLLRRHQPTNSSNAQMRRHITSLISYPAVSE